MLIVNWYLLVVSRYVPIGNFYLSSLLILLEVWVSYLFFWTFWAIYLSFSLNFVKKEEEKKRKFAFLLWILLCKLHFHSSKTNALCFIFIMILWKGLTHLVCSRSWEETSFLSLYIKVGFVQLHLAIEMSSQTMIRITTKLMLYL